MTDTHVPRPLTAAAGRWRTFWFAEEPAYPLGLVRIAFGGLVVAWTLSLLPDMAQLFGTGGIVPAQRLGPEHWGLFATWPSDQGLVVGWAVLLVAGVALTVGWHSRVAALLVYLLVISFEHRNPHIFNSGDNLIRIEALILAISPSGAALSLDRMRTVGSFWSAEVRPHWPVRLMQVQLSVIYLSTVVTKLRGDVWPEGTATSYALRLRDMTLLPVPEWASTSPLLMNVATWGTLAVELALGILVWNRRCRPWVLGAGVLLHLSILATLSVGFFSPAMFVLYLAFVPAEVARRPGDSIRRLRWRRPAPRPKHADQGAP
ncbi:HTTM domain-containing protein [Mycolicibacterium baixiangningiae]|uniref:HTTM domain-containing protein n=1 Tax=Mycolicibacterium baixiangningiae TaxID=2761578 RepID=UPI0018D0EEB8|nr:HTTM domain-containing protein [Mycolicibacterium baixiangningiae]